MLMLVPNPTTPNWATTYSVAPFFADRAYRGCLAPGENVLPLPVQSGGDSMLWQVESDFRFRMAGGRVATPPPSPFMNPESIARVAGGYPITAGEAALLRGATSRRRTSRASSSTSGRPTSGPPRSTRSRSARTWAACSSTAWPARPDHV